MISKEQFDAFNFEKNDRVLFAVSNPSYGKCNELRENHLRVEMYKNVEMLTMHRGITFGIMFSYEKENGEMTIMSNHNFNLFATLDEAIEEVRVRVLKTKK